MTQDYLHKPGLKGLLPEITAGIELPRLLVKAPALARHRNQLQGQVIMVIPGYGANDHYTWLLRQYLKYCGAEVHPWGLGTNRGNINKLLPQLLGKLQQIRQHSGRPVALIGWSLGGVLARELARQAPQNVASVITLGSPLFGGPRYTLFHSQYSKQGYDLAELEAEANQRNARPIYTPVTSVYSKRDGIVSWRASIDTVNPQARNIEVRTPHFAMTSSAEVFAVIVDTLSHTPGPK